MLFHHMYGGGLIATTITLKQLCGHNQPTTHKIIIVLKGYVYRNSELADLHENHLVKIGRIDSGFSGVQLLSNASFAGLSYPETIYHSSRNNSASPLIQHLQLKRIMI